MSWRATARAASISETSAQPWPAAGSTPKSSTVNFSAAWKAFGSATSSAHDHGDISVVMSGNRSYQNILGCIVENNRSSFATIYVRSSGDRFEDNGLGCQIGGGLVSSPGAANSNSTVFECHGTHFIDNTRTYFFNTTGPDFTEFGGLLVVGGDAVAAPAPPRQHPAGEALGLQGCRESEH